VKAEEKSAGTGTVEKLPAEVLVTNGSTLAAKPALSEETKSNASTMDEVKTDISQELGEKPSVNHPGVSGRRSALGKYEAVFNLVNPVKPGDSQMESSRQSVVGLAQNSSELPITVDPNLVADQSKTSDGVKPGEKILQSQPAVFQAQPIQLTEAKPETAPAETNHPVAKEQLFSQIVERANVMVSNGYSEMQVSLKPEHLGKVHLKVAVENQLITAQFVADSQQVKEVIESNLNVLRRQLQESGMKVDTLTVSVGQQNLSGNFSQSSFQQQRQGFFQPTAGIRQDQKMAAVEEEVRSGVIPRNENSRVDFVA
jgi:flagellar hook-length control protein FliK